MAKAIKCDCCEKVVFPPDCFFIKFFQPMNSFEDPILMPVFSPESFDICRACLREKFPHLGEPP